MKLSLTHEKTMDLSVVIPVHNSEKTLEKLYSRLVDVLEASVRNFEIILVDDGSSDGSWETLVRLRELDERVSIIRLMRNFGQHNAIFCGLHHVKGDLILTMDDDLQNPPEEIPKLLDKIEEGYDAVYGEYNLKQHNLFRNLGSAAIQKVYRFVFRLDGTATSFRLISNQVIKAILSYDMNYTFIDGLLAWYTKNIGHVTVRHDPREESSSGYSFRKLFTLSLNLLTNFSIIPLQIASLTGISFSFLGFVMAMYFFMKKIIIGVEVTGYTSLIVVVTFFSGIQLLALGLIGEYLGRVHLNINKKPQFMVKEKMVGRNRPVSSGRRLDIYDMAR